MTAVWKFPLDLVSDLIGLAMPAGAEILFVGTRTHAQISATVRKWLAGRLVDIA